MNTFKLKALPLATAAALAMVPYSLSAQPIVTVNAGFNASAMSSISSPALGPLSGTRSVGLEHTIDTSVDNPSGSGSESQGSGNDDATAMPSLPGLAEGNSSDQEAPADAVDNAVASLEGNPGGDDPAINDMVAMADEATTEVTSTLEEDSQEEDGNSSDQEAPADAVDNAIASLEGNPGGDDPAINDMVAMADEATTEVTSTFEEDSQQAQEPASEQEPEASNTDEPAEDGSTQPDAPSSADMHVAASARVDVETGLNFQAPR